MADAHDPELIRRFENARSTRDARFAPAPGTPLFFVGNPHPFAIASLTSNPADPNATSATLGAGDFWISAPALSSSALANSYAGVRITGGVMKFSAPARIIAGVPQFLANTQFEFDLNFDTTPPAAQAGPGQDALSVAGINPATLQINLVSISATLTLPTFSYTVYGQTIQYTPTNGAAQLVQGRLLFPCTPDTPSFAPATVQSDLFIPSGSAPILSGGWSMITSSADPNNLPATDSGALVLQLDFGLNASSSRLQGRSDLGPTTLTAQPGQITIFSKAQQTFSQIFPLWQAQGKFASVDFRSTPDALLVYLAMPGDETFGAGGIPDPHLDRPLNSQGQVFSFAFTGGFLVMAESSTGTTINIGGIPVPDPPSGRVIFMTVALENALLFTSLRGVFDLQATLGADNSAQSGSLSLVHKLLGFVPILPDPYAANTTQQGAGEENLTATFQISWSDPASPVLSVSSSASPVSTLETILLDVSGAVDQLGVGAGVGGQSAVSFNALHWRFPHSGVVLMTVPEISWEIMSDDGSSGDSGPILPPNDGGPSAVSLPQTVTLVPVTPAFILKSTLDQVAAGDQFQLDVTLPFGLRADIVESQFNLQSGSSIQNLRPSFTNGLQGANQISFIASTASSPAHFHGTAVFEGAYGKSVLGNDIAAIFQAEFSPPGNPDGVPLQRYDLCGYGASVFSDWRRTGLPPGSDIIQARFNVFTGRAAYEVIEAQAYMYPWGVRVVRTVTIERKAAGFVLRHDSGWQAASEGLFTYPVPAGFTFHLGPVEGVVNVRNIKENGEQFPNAGAIWQPVHFDAEVVLAPGISILSGADSNGRFQSTGVPGYLQLLPPKTAVTPDQWSGLMFAVGPVRANIAGTVVPSGGKLPLRASSVEVSTAFKAAGQALVIVALRGAPVLPSLGSWSVARRQAFPNSAPVALEPNSPVPLIQNSADTSKWHIADPSDIERLDNPSNEYGLIQATGTQKLYFARPQIVAGTPDVNLPVPPHLGDVGALLNAVSAFPVLEAALQPPAAPNITTSDGGVSVSMEWDVPPSVGAATLLGFGDVSVQLDYGYKDRDAGGIDKRTHVKAEISPTGWDVSLTKVRAALVTPFGDINDSILSIVGTLKASSTSAPTVTDLDVVYGAILGSVQSVFANLQQLAKFLPGGIGASLDVHFSDGKLTIRDRFALPKLPLGIGFITDVALDLGVTIALAPPSLNLLAGISAPEKPFHWLVSPLSGSGCVQVGYENANPAILIQGGIGAGLAIDLGIASGSASIVIALQVKIASDIQLQAMLTGQASVDVLDGLASASITLTAGLGLVPEPFPPRIGTKPLDDVILRASCAVGIHISICWVVDIDFDGAWQFSQTVDVPDITSVIPI